MTEFGDLNLHWMSSVLFFQGYMIGWLQLTNVEEICVGRRDLIHGLSFRHLRC